MRQSVSTRGARAKEIATNVPGARGGIACIATDRWATSAAPMIAGSRADAPSDQLAAGAPAAPGAGGERAAGDEVEAPPPEPAAPPYLSAWDFVQDQLHRLDLLLVQRTQ